MIDERLALPPPVGATVDKRVLLRVDTASHQRRAIVHQNVELTAGDSDITWTAQTGVGYRFRSVDALFGWG